MKKIYPSLPIELQSERSKMSRAEKENLEDLEYSNWFSSGAISMALRSRELTDLPKVFKLASRIPKSVLATRPDDVFLHPEWNTSEAVVVCKTQTRNGYVITTDGIRNPGINTYVTSQEVDPHVLEEFSRPYRIVNNSSKEVQEHRLKIAIPEDWNIGEVNEMVKLFNLKLVREDVPLGIHTSLDEEDWNKLKVLQDLKWIDAIKQEFQTKRGS